MHKKWIRAFALLLTLLVGFAIGAESGIRTRTRTVTRTQTAPTSLPLDCRSALTMGSNGLILAIQSLSQLRTVPASQVPTLSGARGAQVEAAFQQFTQMSQTCQEHSGQGPAPG
jgi:hypothetical protein